MKKIDVYIITYTETNGDSNFRFIKNNIFPEVKRIDNIKGRSNAYKAVFDDTDADYVYIVEGDHNVNVDFKFDAPPDEAVHVWPSVNRSNQWHTYASGIKLFPVKPFKGYEFNKFDILLGLETPIVLERGSASTHQWDYTDFATFSHTTKQNLKLRAMISEEIAGAQEEYDKWMQWELHPEFSRDNIRTFWEFAETLNLDDLPEDFFDNYDQLKQMFIDSFIKVEK